MPPWSPAELVDVVAAALRERAKADDLEQAVYGFDSLAELGLHPLVREAFRAAGYGAWPEQRYPSDWGKAARSQGLRCDLVLTRQGLPLRDAQAVDTLFGRVPAADADEAYWLEIKSVAQFESSGPFRRYSAELFSPVAADIRKLLGDGVIRHAGLLLILMTASREVAEHDLASWHSRCLDRGVPVAAPAVRGMKITDRIGNAWCAAAVFGVRGV